MSYNISSHENTIYLQVSPLISRICGSYWNANPTAQTSHATACTFAHPFKVKQRRNFWMLSLTLIDTSKIIE